jgi:ABC-type glutathione transport system ATPase component
MLFLAADAVIYTLLGIYLDQVLPSDYGVPKPWNFCCKCKKAKTVVRDDMQPLNEDDEMSLVSNPRNFEPVADALKRQEGRGECLKVRGLVKQFGTKRAVNGTNLTMYKGQIFALLGHNGAGKTTTLSMLTGLLKPTAGRAEVFGINVFEDMDEIRKILGVCPQHDVLFRNLTPEEHLRIYTAFKGSKPSEIDEQVDQMLIDIDLVDQRH